METSQGKRYEEVHFVDSTRPVWNYSLFKEEDIRNFQNGTHYRLYDLFGSHRISVLDTEGYYFAVWAPNATAISVIGYFNNWDPEAHPLYVRLDRSGIWEGFIPNIGDGETYKYYIKSSTGEDLEKSDPFALRWEEPPRTASMGRRAPSRSSGSFTARNLSSRSCAACTRKALRSPPTPTSGTSKKRRPKLRTVEQRDKQFSPHVLAGW